MKTPEHHIMAFLAGLLILCGGCKVSPEKQSGKPNLILIVTDDQGYADASFRGSPIQTPNIDRIVTEGVLLNRFYTCPVCSPTRAGMMTGRFPVRFGMQRAVNRPFSTIGLPANIKTLPELLGEAGYEHRHMVGKWHLGNMVWEHLPLRQGFTSCYGPYNSGIDYFKHTRWEEHDWHRDDSTVFEQGYATDLQSDEVVRLIYSHKGSKDPFFIYFPYSSPHTPLMAPEKEILKYAHLGDKKATYAAMVSIIDQGIGRILDALEKTNQDQNTLIVFMSDNGGSRIASDNTPLRGNKGTLWEGGIRVIAAARWPGRIPPGFSIDRPCSYVDILPTFIEAAGRPGLLNNEILDGRSIIPLLLGKEWDETGWEFFSFYEKYSDSGGGEELSLIQDHLKLIRRGKPILDASGLPEEAIIELYDIASDTAESNNIAREYPELIQEMLVRLRHYRSLRPEGGVPPMVEPIPEGWEPPENWELTNK
ncbi:MAG: sulfatase-like hydrolase/transferase [Bacteroidota bacterium]